jgi:hypothetical protein
LVGGSCEKSFGGLFQFGFGIFLKGLKYRASLRTTVPASIVRQFNLRDGDKLDWSLDIKNGTMIVLVQPVKKAENKAERRH